MYLLSPRVSVEQETKHTSEDAQKETAALLMHRKQITFGYNKNITVQD